MRSGVKQIFNESQILLFALDAGTKSSRPRFLQLFPEIIATLEPLFAPRCPLLLRACGLSGTGNRKNNKSVNRRSATKARTS